MLLPSEIDSTKRTILLDMYTHSDSEMNPIFNPNDIYARTGITPANGQELLKILVNEGNAGKQGNRYGITTKGIEVVKKYVLEEEINSSPEFDKDFEWLKKWEYGPKLSPLFNIQLLRNIIAPGCEEDVWNFLTLCFDSKNAFYEDVYFFIKRSEAEKFLENRPRIFNQIRNKLGAQLAKTEYKNYDSPNTNTEYLSLAPWLWMIAKNNFSPLETAHNYFDLLEILPAKYFKGNTTVSESLIDQTFIQIQGENKKFRPELIQMHKRNLFIVGLLRPQHATGMQNPRNIYIEHFPQDQPFSEWLEQFIYNYKLKIPTLPIQNSLLESLKTKEVDAHKMFPNSLPMNAQHESPVETSKNFEIENIATSIHSDIFAAEDLLGYDTYAKAITEFIKHKDTKPPLSIGVFAPWGLGKTTLLKFIEDNFLKEKEKKIKGKSAYPTVWFNAWKYENSEQIWAALIHNIIVQLLEPLNLLEKICFWLNFHRKRLHWEKIAKDIFNESILFVYFFLVFVTILSFFFFKIISSSLLLKSSLFSLVGILSIHALHISYTFIKKVRKPFIEKLNDYIRKNNYEHRIGFFHEVEKDLALVLDLLVQKNKPVIILIDDLDRCSPSKVVDVVESLNHFLAGNISNCVFIIGADAEMVAASIETVYEKITDKVSDYKNLGWHFMDKFVQLPFVIPTTASDVLRKFASNLFSRSTKKNIVKETILNAKNEIDAVLNGGKIRDQFDSLSKNLAILKENDEEQEIFEKIIEKVAEESLDEQTDVKYLFDNYLNELSSSPRLIKRFANLYRFYNYIQYLRALEGLPNATMDELGFWIVIMLRWPELTRWIQWGSTKISNELDTPTKRADFITVEIPLGQKSFMQCESEFTNCGLNLTEELFSFLKRTDATNKLARALETGIW